MVNLYFCHFVYYVKKAKELKTITFVGKLTFPYQIQSSALNLLERNGSAGFLTTRQPFSCPPIRGNVLGNRFSCTISLMAWKSIHYLDDGEKRWREIIGHTSEQDDEEGEITFENMESSLFLVYLYRRKARTDLPHLDILKNNWKWELWQNSLRNKHNNSNNNNNSNKGLTLAGIKHSVNWKGFCQIRKAFRLLLPGSCSCRGLVFRVTELSVLLHYSVLAYCKIPSCKLNQLLICWKV